MRDVDPIIIMQGQYYQLDHTEVDYCSSPVLRVLTYSLARYSSIDCGFTGTLCNRGSLWIRFHAISSAGVMRPSSISAVGAARYAIRVHNSGSRAFGVIADARTLALRLSSEAQQVRDSRYNYNEGPDTDTHIQPHEDS